MMINLIKLFSLLQKYYISQEKMKINKKIKKQKKSNQNLLIIVFFLNVYYMIFSLKFL